jgi:hypothetical protein
MGRGRWIYRRGVEAQDQASLMKELDGGRRLAQLPSDDNLFLNKLLLRPLLSCDFIVDSDHGHALRLKDVIRAEACVIVPAPRQLACATKYLQAAAHSKRQARGRSPFSFEGCFG